MERVIIQVAFFLICFNISGLATTNILRLTSGNQLPILASKCYCESCGTTIPPFFQLPIISYVASKGKCRNCGTTIPVDGLFLEIIVLTVLCITLSCFDFSVKGVTISFISYEIIRAIVIIRKGKRENDFVKQYVVAVLAMLPHYVITVFVSLLYDIVCNK